METNLIKEIGIRNYLKLMDCLKDNVEMRIEQGQLVIKFLRENMDAKF